MNSLPIDAPPPPDLRPLRTDAHQMPGIERRWDGASTRAGWDTGAGITLADETRARAHPDVVTILPEQDCGIPDLSSADWCIDFPVRRWCITK